MPEPRLPDGIDENDLMIVMSDHDRADRLREDDFEIWHVPFLGWVIPIPVTTGKGRSYDPETRLAWVVRIEGTLHNVARAELRRGLPHHVVYGRRSRHDALARFLVLREVAQVAVYAKLKARARPRRLF